jgi:hypothetical protein
MVASEPPASHIVSSHDIQWQLRNGFEIDSRGLFEVRVLLFLGPVDMVVNIMAAMIYFQGRMVDRNSSAVNSGCALHRAICRARFVNKMPSYLWVLVGLIGSGKHSLLILGRLIVIRSLMQSTVLYVG